MGERLWDGSEKPGEALQQGQREFVPDLQRIARTVDE